MKSGETGYLQITISNLTSEALDLVDNIIFSIKSKSALLQMEYPGAVSYEDGAFLIPLTQEDTTALVGHYMVEAQVNFTDKSVSKSNIYSGKVESTIHTEFIDDNAPSDTDTQELTLTISEVQIVSGGGTGTSDYTQLTNKPQINSVTLTGNKTAADLGLASATHTHTSSDVSGLSAVATSGSYNDLSNKPTIPTYTAGTGISIENNVISATGGGGGGASIDDTTTSTTSTWSSSKVTTYTQKAKDITEALETSGAVIKQSSANLLTIPDFSGYYGGLHIEIENSIVHVYGTATDYVNIKLTNGVDVGLGASGGAKKSAWQQESMSNLLQIGKKYSLTDFDTDLDVKIAIANVVTSARDNTYANLISRSKGLVTLEKIPSYIQLYIRQTQTVDLKVGIVLMENEIPTSYIPPVSSDRYVYTTVSTLRNAGIIGDCISKFTLGEPTVVSGQSPYNVQGCCSDGDYIYYGAVSYDDTDNTRVGKIRISDMTLVTEVENYSLGHCNSMTYCNADGYIHCVALDNVGTVHRITTDLSYVDSYTVSFSNFDASYTGVRGIAYSNELRKFVYAIRATDKEGFAICSKERDFERMFWADRRQINALGGIECDKNFIYQVCYDKNVRTDDIYNSFEVFTWSGKRVAVLPVALTGETEEIANVKGTLYINENDAHVRAKFYKIVPTSTKMVGLV